MPTWLRRSFLVITATLFASFLFMSATLLTVQQTIADREQVKEWLSETDTYEKIVPTITDEITNDQPILRYVPDDIVRAVSIQVFDATYIQTSFDSFIDTLYDWLEGKKEFQYEIDLKSRISVFAQTVRSQAETYTAGLSPCTQQQLASIDPSNPFALECLPPVDMQTVLDEFQATIEDTLNANDQLNIETSSLEFEDKQGQAVTINELFKDVPVVYQTTLSFVWPIVLLTLVFAILIVLLSPTKRTGAKRVAKTLLLSGMLLSISTYIFVQLFQTFPVSSQSTIETIVRPIIEAAGRDIASLSYLISAVFIGVGLSVIVAFWVEKRLSKNSTKPTSEQPIPLQNEANKATLAPKTEQDKTSEL